MSDEQVEIEEQELPEDTSDRTKQEFEKLKQSNQELKQERDAIAQEAAVTKNLLESLRPEPQITPQASQFPNLNPQQVQNIASHLVDENGYVDTNLLQKTLDEANKRAQDAAERAARAEQIASSAVTNMRQFEENRVMQEVHAKYPDLDPHNKSFNQDLYDAVRNELVGQMVAGKKEDVMGAADKWSKRFGKPVIEEEDPQIKQARENKAQINATNTRTPVAPSTSYDDAELVRRFQRGDMNAFAERMRRAGL